MNNGIIYRQNCKENLLKLMAQKKLYSKAKIILGFEIITQVVLVVGLALIPIFVTDSFLKSHNLKHEYLNLFTISFSIILTLIDLIIMIPIINKERELGASIQEDFDCSVLSIPWNNVKVDKPDFEVVSCNANEYIKAKSIKNEKEEVTRRNALNDFKNWYSPEEIKSLPLEVGRIVCQRTNCWWDNYLRHKYKTHLIICSSLIFVILLIIALVRDLSATNIITNVVWPFFPVLTFTVIKYREHKKSIKCTEKLKTKVSEYWQMIISNPTDLDFADDLSRKLQDEIFENRKDSPLIFDWYYKKYKSKQQRDTDLSGETMINQYYYALKAVERNKNNL